MVVGVFQDDFRPGKGNALQACVASILELPLSSVPNFAATDDPYATLHSFLEPMNLGFLKVEIPQPTSPFKSETSASADNGGTAADQSQELLPFAPAREGGAAMCVLAGPSPRGSHRHAVVGRAVGRRLEAVFDPHPDGGMLAGPPVWAGFLVSLDPAHVVKKK